MEKCQAIRVEIPERCRDCSVAKRITQIVNNGELEMASRYLPEGTTGVVPVRGLSPFERERLPALLENCPGQITQEARGGFRAALSFLRRQMRETLMHGGVVYDLDEGRPQREESRLEPACPQSLHAIADIAKTGEYQGGWRRHDGSAVGFRDVSPATVD